jgi:hypothetical protein
MNIILFLLICAFGIQTDRTVDAIPLPAGFHRATVDVSSFGAWLRKVPLKKDNTV